RRQVVPERHRGRPHLGHVRDQRRDDRYARDLLAAKGLHHVRGYSYRVQPEGALMKRPQPSLSLALVLCSIMTGCWTTTVSSGKPVSHAKSASTTRWHSGILTGGVELSGPHELKRICPNGWAEVETETSPFNVIAEFATFHLYAPQMVRIRCADAPAHASQQ